MIAFGPVPSRRLGQSLGVNNIPPERSSYKRCSYSCIYCQVGPTTRVLVERQTLYPPAEVVRAVETRVTECRAAGQPVDFISFVPDGEPTLDANLGLELRELRPQGIPLAVITNGSLLSLPSVRRDLEGADLVSVKVDAVREDTWKRINRPDRRLDLRTMLNGILAFARSYSGELITETMLLKGLNDDAAELEELAAFLVSLSPSRAYLGLPTRPTATSLARTPDEETTLRAHQILSRALGRVELLGLEAGGHFGRTGEPVDDLLAILAVHPMREVEARAYLVEGGEGPERVEELVTAVEIARVEHGGEVFLVRKIGGGSS